MPTNITNSTLSSQIAELLNKWQNRENEMQTWIGGSATGGPYADGRFPLTDTLGVVRYTKSPAALESSVAGSASAAAASASSAATSASNASAAQAAAEAARNLALTYRDSALAARDLALTYRNDAANEAANALTHRNAAASSASAAATSATNAATSATNAASSASAASTSATNAAASASAAAASAAAAATFNPALYTLKAGTETINGVWRFDTNLRATAGMQITGDASADLLGVSGLEIGGAGDLPYLQSYNRGTSQHNPLRLYSSLLKVYNAGTLIGEWGNRGSGSTKELALTGTTYTAHFMYGADEAVYLRAGKQTGAINIGDAPHAGVKINNRDDSLTANIFGASAIHQYKASGAIRHIIPRDGAYSENSNGLTGALRIQVPINASNTMLSFKVRGYNYVTGRTWELLLAGYDYTEPRWYNTTAVVTAGEPFFQRVRFGRDGSNFVVILGETNTSWEYPQVEVTEATIGYSGQANDWHTGWSITRVTSLASVTVDTDHSIHINNRGDVLRVGDAYLTAYTGNYGAFAVEGNRNGYSGIAFTSANNTPTLMASTSSTLFGAYFQGLGRWMFYDDNSYMRVNKPIIEESSTLPYVRFTSGAAAGGGRITVSTSAASGTPADGDIWIQRAA